MGLHLAHPFRIKQSAAQLASRNQPAQAQPGIGLNGILALGLWTLLWLGYNTHYGYALNRHFSDRPTYFIHGVRAFAPFLAAWIAFLMIFARAKRLFPWIISPLGLMLFYALIGLIASEAFSANPIDAMYYGANYLAIVMALLAIVPVKDPLPDLRRVLNFTWIIGTLMTLSLLGLIPFLGSEALIQSEGPVGVRAYGGGAEFLDMPMTRNTGFARYAAMSALVALPRLMRRGRIELRIIYGFFFVASLYALVLANGRTETLAFIGGVAIILFMEKTKRAVNTLVGAAFAILLGLRGFYTAFYFYITRTGHIDPTMTGRTVTWSMAMPYLWGSPWVGLGFQADRYLLQGQHMHNAFMHALFQSGFLGGGGVIIGVLITWGFMINYFFLNQPSDRSLIPPEIPAIFLFVTISSLTESTFAYFSAAWLLSAPIVPYVMALHWHMQKISVRDAKERAWRFRLAREKARLLDAPSPMPPSPAG